MVAKTGTRAKKGSIADIFTISFTVAFVGFMLLVGLKIMNTTDTYIQADADIPTEAKTASTTLKGHFGGIIDNSLLFLAVFLGIASIALASMVRVHPIFIPFFIIAELGVILFCGMASNIYQTAAESTELAQEAATLNGITFILTYLPFIVAVLGTLIMVVMYKSYNEGY